MAVYKGKYTNYSDEKKGVYKYEYQGNWYTKAGYNRINGDTEGSSSKANKKVSSGKVKTDFKHKRMTADEHRVYSRKRTAFYNKMMKPMEPYYYSPRLINEDYEIAKEFKVYSSEIEEENKKTPWILHTLYFGHGDYMKFKLKKINNEDFYGFNEYKSFLIRLSEDIIDNGICDSCPKGSKFYEDYYFSNDKSIKLDQLLFHIDKDRTSMNSINAMACIFNDLYKGAKKKHRGIEYTEGFNDIIDSIYAYTVDVFLALHISKITNDLLPLFIIKSTKREDFTDKVSYFSCITEFIIGSYVTKYLRTVIPNFSCVYGKIGCLTPSVEMVKRGQDLISVYCLPERLENYKTFTFAQEYIAGVSLYSWINDNFNEKTFVHIVLQVLCSLAVGQKILGMNHGDLHADNIIIRVGEIHSKIKYDLRDEEGNGKVYNINSEYIATIIDYGRSSIDNPVKDEYSKIAKRIVTPVSGSLTFFYSERNYAFDCIFFFKSCYEKLKSTGKGGAKCINFIACILRYFVELDIPGKSIDMAIKTFYGSSPDPRIIFPDSRMKYDINDFIEYMIISSKPILGDDYIKYYEINKSEESCLNPGITFFQSDKIEDVFSPLRNPDKFNIGPKECIEIIEREWSTKKQKKLIDTMEEEYDICVDTLKDFVSDKNMLMVKTYDDVQKKYVNSNKFKTKDEITKQTKLVAEAIENKLAPIVANVHSFYKSVLKYENQTKLIIYYYDLYRDKYSGTSKSKPKIYIEDYSIISKFRSKGGVIQLLDHMKEPWDNVKGEKLLIRKNHSMQYMNTYREMLEKKIVSIEENIKKINTFLTK